MREAFYIIVILSLFFSPCYTNAQEKEIEDYIIELPLEIDEPLNEIYFDEEITKTIKSGKNHYRFYLIEDINQPKKINTAKKELLKKAGLPFMPDIKDTVAAIITDPRLGNSPQLLLIIGLTEKNELRYFYKVTDSCGINKEYKNITFYEPQQFKLLQVSCPDKQYDFILFNPFFVPRPYLAYGFSNKKEEPKFQVVLTMGIHQGVSSLRYKTDTSQTISSVYYEARIMSGFTFKVRGYYNIRKFMAGLFINYENLNYENNTRIVSSRNHSGQITHDYTGHGSWPEELFHIGISTSYDFLVFDNLILSPTLDAGLYFHTSDTEPFDIEENGSAKDFLKERYSLSIGGLIKFPVYDKFWFTVGGNYQFNHFDARDYFADIKPNSYRSRQEIYRFEFGVCYNF